MAKQPRLTKVSWGLWCVYRTCSKWACWYVQPQRPRQHPLHARWRWQGFRIAGLHIYLFIRLVPLCWCVGGQHASSGTAQWCGRTSTGTCAGRHLSHICMCAAVRCSLEQYCSWSAHARSQSNAVHLRRAGCLVPGLHVRCACGSATAVSI